jgi:hypothetical protein
MWNFVSGNKARLALSAETKFHIYKSTILADIMRSKLPIYNFYNGTVQTRTQVSSVVRYARTKRPPSIRIDSVPT